MAEVSFLPSANTRERASASREEEKGKYKSILLTNFIEACSEINKELQGEEESYLNLFPFNANRSLVDSNHCTL